MKPTIVYPGEHLLWLICSCLKLCTHFNLGVIHMTKSISPTGHTFVFMQYDFLVFGFNFQTLASNLVIRNKLVGNALDFTIWFANISSWVVSPHVEPCNFTRVGWKHVGISGIICQYLGLSCRPYHTLIILARGSVISSSYFSWQRR